MREGAAGERTGTFARAQRRPAGPGARSRPRAGVAERGGAGTRPRTGNAGESGFPARAREALAAQTGFLTGSKRNGSGSGAPAEGQG